MDERGGEQSDDHLPVMLDLRGWRCLVVGAGEVGRRRAAQLAGAGASVTLVAPDAEESAGVEALSRTFRSEDLDDCRLIVAATGDHALDEGISAEARRRGVLVAIADDASLSDLIMPAVLRRGRVTLAVSTQGASPALAALLRDLIGAEVGPEWGELAEMLAELRASWDPPGLSQRQRADVWRHLVALRLDRYIAAGHADEARGIAESTLNGYLPDPQEEG